MRQRPAFSLIVLGRLHGLTRARLDALVAAAGGRLLKLATGRADLVAIGHGTSAGLVAHDCSLALPPGLRADVRLLSENSLRRLLGVLPALPEENRTLFLHDVARSVRLEPETLRILALYDVIEPESDAFSFRDLRAAREAARLLEAGCTPPDVIEASVALTRAGRSLADARLREGEDGAIGQDVGGAFATLDGQFTFGLERELETVDDVLERAEDCEEAGDLDAAERWYGLAARMDRTDPVPTFNLGNVLGRLGREQEALFAYQGALARDPAFAEAWVNLGILYEDAGRMEAARSSYTRAIAARPDYPQALYNLALLLTHAEEFADAIPLWERYLATAPEDRRQATRLLSLCRIGATAADGQGAAKPAIDEAS